MYESAPRTLDIGAWTLDAAARTMISDYGPRVSLSRRETELLAVLAGDSGRVFSRPELATTVFATPVTPAAVDTYVHYLRRKLGRNALSTQCTAPDTSSETPHENDQCRPAGHQGRRPQGQPVYRIGHRPEPSGFCWPPSLSSSPAGHSLPRPSTGPDAPGTPSKTAATGSLPWAFAVFSESCSPPRWDYSAPAAPSGRSARPWKPNSASSRMPATNCARHWPSSTPASISSSAGKQPVYRSRSSSPELSTTCS
ncbi:putative transcriptional regulator (plasmid) [Arthrobacter sp. ZXY-2]|nr:putative transcriptional regulator [Arthrobacter sp. ZXY-2]